VARIELGQQHQEYELQTSIISSFAFTKTSFVTGYPRDMSTSKVAARLVELCKAFKNFDAMQELYADNIVSVEATAKPDGSFETAGKTAVIQKSAAWAAANEIHGATTEGPYLAKDQFAVVFDFDVTNKASGQRESLREIGVYTVEGDFIVREEFFYGEGGGNLAR
jgi:hypothetical protein